MVLMTTSKAEKVQSEMPCAVIWILDAEELEHDTIKINHKHDKYENYCPNNPTYTFIFIVINHKAITLLGKYGLRSKGENLGEK